MDGAAGNSTDNFNNAAPVKKGIVGGAKEQLS